MVIPGSLLRLNVAEAIEDRFRRDERLNLDFELPTFSFPCYMIGSIELLFEESN